MLRLAFVHVMAHSAVSTLADELVELFETMLADADSDGDSKAKQKQHSDAEGDRLPFGMGLFAPHAFQTGSIVFPS